jgi:hypothetical protein
MAVKTKFSESKTSLKVNLKELLGRKVDDEDIVEALAQKAIDMIVERTQDGKDVKGRNFKPVYSDEYVKSDAFKAFGKKKGVPNLTLTGDMLGLLEPIATSATSFEIGWTDPVENAKAYNHNVGDTLPKRQFLGLQKQELDELRAYAEKLLDE